MQKIMNLPNNNHALIYADMMTSAGLITPMRMSGLVSREPSNIGQLLSFQAQNKIIEKIATNPFIPNKPVIDETKLLQQKENINNLINFDKITSIINNNGLINLTLNKNNLDINKLSQDLPKLFGSNIDINTIKIDINSNDIDWEKTYSARTGKEINKNVFSYQFNNNETLLKNFLDITIPGFIFKMGFKNTTIENEYSCMNNSKNHFPRWF